jgi:lipoprotein-anchoring transpeptidase ErfK/SrfK
LRCKKLRNANCRATHQLFVAIPLRGLLTLPPSLALLSGISSPFQDSPVTFAFSRAASLIAALFLAACAAQPVVMTKVSIPGYEEVQDGAFLIPAVNPRILEGRITRGEVDYAGSESPGTIVVDTHSRRLYLVMEGARAMRYPIAVGRDGLAFQGSGTIQRKEEWPHWTPTANMVRTRPDLYAAYAGGLPGGLINPLGARAMYLYRNGRDSYFRIHGTIQNETIGHATSAGCIRLFNQDAIDLFTRVPLGTRVKVRSLAESIALDGPYMDDYEGHAVPETPENIAQKERDLVTVAKRDAARAAAAAEAAPEVAPNAADTNG